MNDAPNPDEFTLHYITVDQVICMVSRFGKGAKFDVEAAYQNIPIHPPDCYLLGMKWCYNFYVDLALPLGPLYFLLCCRVSGMDPSEQLYGS